MKSPPRITIIVLSLILFFVGLISLKPTTSLAQAAYCSFTPDSLISSNIGNTVTVTAIGLQGQVSLENLLYPGTYTSLGTIDNGETKPFPVPDNTSPGTYNIKVGGYMTVCTGSHGTNFVIQQAQVTCSPNSITFQGSDHTPGTGEAEVPMDTQFWIKMSCTTFPDYNTHDVTFTIDTIARKHTLSGVVNQQFGAYYDLPMPPDSVRTFPITVQISGLRATCNSSCYVSVHSGTTNPKPTILPLPNCLNFWRYSPDVPVIGQPFQIRFTPNSTNINNGISSYELQWETDQPAGTYSVNPIASDINTVWITEVSGINSKFFWKVLFQGDPCGVQDTLFASAIPPPSPGLGEGKNPCIDTNGDGKVDRCLTAIGSIPTNLGDFATAVLRIALGISGGIVLILMVIGSIRVMTSSGDPKNVAAGRDMIVAAIAGALFIAFSVMIMQFLGTTIVPIPGLTYGT